MTKPHVSVVATDQMAGGGNSLLVRHLRESMGVAAERGARAVLVIECAPIDSVDAAAAIERTPPAADRADRLAARLGTEHTVLVHDARRCLDPGLLAAEAGTVPAGGALVLLVPPLDGWADAPMGGRFVARFIGALRTSLSEAPAIIRRLALEPADLAGLQPGSGVFAAADLQARLDVVADADRSALAVDTDALALQARLLRRAMEHLRGEARALLVIEAPRGRGKSALLGRLSATLARDGIEHRICAARRSALDVLARHRACGSDAPAELPFIAPDEAQATTGDVLLVDEAASLPIPVIERLLARWSRLVLASTTAGYESSGRAFAVTLPTLLDRERPNWLRLAPTEPMRWRSGDPLDDFVNRTLTPTASTVSTSLDEPPSAWQTARADEVDRDALAVDEPRLAALFGLLVSTHYQSTPLDLAHLLDAENLRLWSIEQADTVLAVALVAVESGVPTSLHDAVLARRRRLPHDLLPQLLAQCANRPDALDASLARIVRIAVLPHARRHGLASRLLRRIVKDVADDVEGVGASFGASPASLALWSSNGFDVFHRGYRHNPRSGQRSIAVLAATSGRVADVLDTAMAIHQDNHGPAPLDERASLASTTRTVVAAHGTVGSSAHDDALLRRFAVGERSLWDTRGALRRLADRPATEAGTEAVTEDSPRVVDHPDTDGESGDRELVRWLRALGSDVPVGRRARESRLREQIASRLARTRPPGP